MDKKFGWRQFAVQRVRILAVLSVIAVLAGNVGASYWQAELFSHFVPYYAAVFVLAVCLDSGWKRWLWLGAASVLLLWLAQPFEGERPSETHHSLLWYNVNLDNRKAAEESAKILAAAPEVLALAEIDLADSGWQALRRSYPYGCEWESDSPFALAVWSRKPLAGCEVRFVGDYPYIRAVAGNTALFALHPPPPVSASLAVERREYLAQTAVFIGKEENVLVVGDLNSSPFSPLFRSFTETAGIRAQTRFWTPTWLPFGLNLDHVLAKRPVRAEPLPWRHSDHRALMVRW